jgi:hypothetical protein
MRFSEFYYVGSEILSWQYQILFKVGRLCQKFYIEARHRDQSHTNNFYSILIMVLRKFTQNHHVHLS